MVMDLVIWPATLVPVVFPTRLFRRELFPLGIFQSGTTLGFKRVPRAPSVTTVANPRLISLYDHFFSVHPPNQL